MVLDRMRLNYKQELFFSGETLKGSVEFKVTGEETRIKWLKMHFRGHVQVEYEEIIESANYTKRNNKIERNVLLDKEIYILSPSEYKIAVGNYEYPFSMALPAGLPPSIYTKSKCEIVYTGEAIVEVENDLPEEQIITEEEPFFVNNIMDLNGRKDGVNEHLDLEETISYGPMCCINGPIIVEANMKRSGWVPGEKVPIMLRVTNKTDKHLIMEMKMIQTVVFLVDQLVKPKDDDIILTNQMGTIKPGESTKVFNYIFKIPPLPTQFRVDIMELDYELEIEAITDGPEENLKINTDLCIGNVPLMEDNAFDRFKEKDTIDLPDTIMKKYPNLRKPKVDNAKRNMPYVTYTANHRHKLKDENGQVILEPEPKKEEKSKSAKQHQKAGKNMEMTTDF